ncbi:hypothetical protein EVAR_57076_1 [Eumeta japonica]|uniref:Uncharacterized protein n=1 Tax=Eumeta variegata TaxID=151549 RepID=A0A4C1Y5L3_EUMVA|nr:hypothetical protein EVAR_57076_1 [Eumeta japonica]
MRPILITLMNGWKKNEIITNKTKFKDGYISEDFPKEVLLKRKELQKLVLVVQERNKGNFSIIKDDKHIVKEREETSNIDKCKRQDSYSPNNLQRSKKHYVSSKTNRINAFDMMRGRNNSLSTFTAPSEHSA